MNTQPKRRGRPPGSKNKPKRGRPVGSKNKPTKVAKKPRKAKRVNFPTFKRGGHLMMMCANSIPNGDWHWHGQTCSNEVHISSDNVSKTVCGECVAKSAPAPKIKQQSTTLPNGEKRGRGRPKGSKNKVKK